MKKIIHVPLVVLDVFHIKPVLLILLHQYVQQHKQKKPQFNALGIVLKQLVDQGLVQIQVPQLMLIVTLS